jgi:hypothetical protein
MILLISASQVARIIDMSQWCPASPLLTDNELKPREIKSFAKVHMAEKERYGGTPQWYSSRVP